MEGEIFEWKSYLNEENFNAASVATLKHAPGAQLWNQCVKIGMKLIFRHKEMLSNQTRRKYAYWIVTVIKIQGYYCLVRYDGMETIDAFDFWIHIGKDDVHPVGAQIHKMVFAPPKQLPNDKVSDWRTYFMTSLPGAVTIPDNFMNLLKKSYLGSKFRVGDHLEVIDKYKISQLRTARVSKIVGRRMYLRYLDDFKDGFFCHEKSSLIHTPGWAACVGHKLKIPTNFDSQNGNTDSLNTCHKSVETSELRKGMKLEAVDPLCPSRICAATVCKVLEFGYMMIKMDCYEENKPATASPQNETECENENGNDWFCYHVKSPYIFECGFCHSNGIPLVPPYRQTVEEFSWRQYFKENHFLAARLPQRMDLEHNLSIGMKVEMVDVMTPMKIHVATIVKIAGRLLRINFDGWEPEFDQWLDVESPDIFPIGWCALVGHQLNGPKTVK